MLSHAAPADLRIAPWSIPAEDLPEAAAVVALRDASRLVDRACMLDAYDTDASGAPTSASVAAALRGATCEQVAHWLRYGVIDGATGEAATAPAVAASTVGPAAVQYVTTPAELASSPGSATYRRASRSALTWGAILYLRARGLTWGMAWSS